MKKGFGCFCIAFAIIFCCYTILFIHLLNTTLNSNGIRIVKYETNESMNKFKKHIILTPSKHECQGSVYKLFRHHCCYAQFAINYLYSLGFTEFDDNIVGKRNRYFKSTILWNRNRHHIFGCYGLNIQQRNETFADPIPIKYKTKIYRIILSYCMQNKIETQCKRFLPHSFDLMKQNERIDFFNLLPCNNEPNNEWILKGDDHRGKGIKFITNTNYLRYFYLNKNEMNNCSVTRDDVNDDEYNELKQTLSNNAVAQQLILNTLKINGCSFHIRSWIILANYNDPLIVLYIDSILYKAVDPNNLITNVAADSSVKLNMRQFAQYFDSVNVTDITHKIKNMIRILYLASFAEYNPSMKDVDAQHYMLMAVDLLITEDLEIKLLEVNSKPMTPWIPQDCFDKNWFGETKMKDIWQCELGKVMMEEIIDIELEIAIKKANRNKIENLDSIKTFQIVLWQ